MNELKKILPREEMDPQFTWATEDLYASDEAFYNALDKLASYQDKISSYQGQFTQNAHQFYSLLQLQDEVEYLADSVAHYAFLKNDQDTKNATYQTMHAKTSAVLVGLSSASSFMEPEILSLSDSTLEQFYQEQPSLEHYRHYLNEIRRKKEHVLSPSEEKLLAAAGEIAQQPSLIGGAFRNADITFPNAIDQNGKEHEVTSGTFIPLMQSSDRELRKSAFQSTYHTYDKFKNTNAAILNSQMKQLSFFANARKYSSTLEASLDHTNVPVAVYKNLIQAVHDNMHYMHKYVALRKKLLQLDEIHMYDLYTPIISDCADSISFEQAKAEVKEATAPLGKEYQDLLQTGFDHRWIDVYENIGKRSGAYSAGAKVHPYVLLNYHDDMNNEFTLAHEMGHALHSYYSNHAQPIIYSNYVIFVAEVASTFNENLLMQYKLKNTTDPKQKAYLINYFLEQFRTTVYRQTMFAEFELLINEEIEKGGSLTSDFLNHLYHQLNVEYYGPDMVVDEEIDLEWARIPHFYYDFYVYQYATGFSAAVALSQKVLKEGMPAVDAYMQFLSGGCSKDPISLLQDAGVDMMSPEPVNDALKLFGTLIDEMEKLL